MHQRGGVWVPTPRDWAWQGLVAWEGVAWRGAWRWERVNARLHVIQYIHTVLVGLFRCSCRVSLPRLLLPEFAACRLPVGIVMCCRMNIQQTAMYNSGAGDAVVS